jgi:hypothetical protein
VRLHQLLWITTIASPSVVVSVSLRLIELFIFLLNFSSLADNERRVKIRKSTDARGASTYVFLLLTTLRFGK